MPLTGTQAFRRSAVAGVCVIATGAEVRQRFGVIVVALKRGERSTFNPAPDERIEAGDTLVALGPIQALERIEQALS